MIDTDALDKSHGLEFCEECGIPSEGRGFCMDHMPTQVYPPVTPTAGEEEVA